MENRIEYKGRIINSCPLKLHNGGFSSNGSIETHTKIGVNDFKYDGFQGNPFDTEEAAYNYYIKEAKNYIDGKYPPYPHY